MSQLTHECKNPEHSHTPAPPQDRLDAMPDKPCMNERYGGLTMRQMVRKVVLRRVDLVQEREKVAKK